ncbi:hypothetical protein [Leptolyngbya sp. NIES-2104]|uniref:hypothetical protein n=1 Tax=Leptolyngbya sp. NIES-2104 TaxID=1552121 RepID=UPI00178CF758|nr:hypothetical protein [Leptolyngbya sp. NIES-2104]
MISLLQNYVTLCFDQLNLEHYRVDAELVTVQIPATLYEKLQALAIEQHTDPISLIANLVIDAAQQSISPTEPSPNKIDLESSSTIRMPFQCGNLRLRFLTKNGQKCPLTCRSDLMTTRN